METAARREAEVLTPRQIYDRLNRYVIGQDEAKRAVAIAAYNHLKRVHARRVRRLAFVKKSNVLLMGPTGSGKTHLARNLAKVLSVPFTSVDATEYTEAGYYGKDVEVMVADLLMRADHSVEEAERGIIFIDEVDKIARRSQGARNGAGSRDIGGEGVQQALLKLLEGRELSVPLNVTQHWNKHDFVQVNTQDILFICAGAFSDLFTYGTESARSIGFGAGGNKKGPTKQVQFKQLVEFGMLPEFLGRLPVVVQLEALTEDEMLRVLTEPPDSIVREYQELLALDSLQLEFTPGALSAVVGYATARELGARGLRSILEYVMSEIMFCAPEYQKRKVTVDEGFVKLRLKQPKLAAI